MNVDPLALRIYTCHHSRLQPYFWNQFTTPLCSDPQAQVVDFPVEVSPNTPVISSAQGENINELRFSACEMTNHFWVRRNVSAELSAYVGFQHYRRIFFLNFLLGRGYKYPQMDRSEAKLIDSIQTYFNTRSECEIQIPGDLFSIFTAHLSKLDQIVATEILDFIKDVDIVLPRKVSVPAGLKSQFGEGFPHRKKQFDYIFDRFVDAVLAHKFFQSSPPHVNFKYVISNLNYAYFLICT